ncbi:MAG TPA: PhzF family phenazine biosynthesis protein [Halanaerobiales bacterium]|nr:PhzF family phenazine biosynthesis protein [Halanaerobiales bacterium]
MEIYQVDAFTNQPYKGNPAAVCILDTLQEVSWLTDVAREMSLPETAFLFKQKDGYNLRWFTPTSEVDLCGHATLASAHVLWETKRVDKTQDIKFNTKSGLLVARKNDQWIELDFPIEAPKEEFAPQILLNALDVKPIYVGKNRFDYLIEVESEEIVKNLDPDFRLLKKVESRGVIVTSRSSFKRYDFISRFFAPSIGIDEDPVTGSAHCALAPYWQNKLNINEFLAYQASERGGSLKIRLGDKRVYLSGQAVTVLKGDLYH